MSTHNICFQGQIRKKRTIVLTQLFKADRVWVSGLYGYVAQSTLLAIEIFCQ